MYNDESLVRREWDAKDTVMKDHGGSERWQYYDYCDPFRKGQSPMDHNITPFPMDMIQPPPRPPKPADALTVVRTRWDAGVSSSLRAKSQARGRASSSQTLEPLQYNQRQETSRPMQQGMEGEAAGKQKQTNLNRGTSESMSDAR